MRDRYTASRVSLIRIAALSTLLAAGAAARPAVAQAPPPSGATPAAPAAPADVQKAMQDIADLDLLKALAPLKLTGEQIVKLLVPMKTASTLAAKTREADYAGLRGVAADLAKARTEALSGTAVSADTEAKVVKVMAESDQRLTAARKQATADILAVAKDVLTAEQKDEVERQASQMLGGKKLVPAKYRSSPSRAPKEEVQELMLGVYIERIFLFDRTIDLLKAMKPAGATSAAAETGAAAAGSAPAPAAAPAAKP